jgi:DNA replication protein DnaC
MSEDQGVKGAATSTTTIAGDELPKGVENSLAGSLAADLRRQDAALADVGFTLQRAAAAPAERRDRYGEPVSSTSINFAAAERRRKDYERREAERSLAERFGRIVDGYAACGLPATYVTGEKSFETYEPKNDSQTEAKRRLMEFVDTSGGFVRWLYIFSDDIGVGKTHLAASAGVRFIARGGFARFITAADLVLWTRLDSERAAEAVAVCRRAPLLILDDLGAEKMTEFSIAIIGQILNSRYEARRLTIITSNFSLGTLGERIKIAGEDVAARRIVDRIAESTVGSALGVIRIGGKSHR